MASSSAEPGRVPASARATVQSTDSPLHGVLAAWAVLALEFIYLAFAHHREFAGSWELEVGAVWLAPTVLSVAALCGVIGYVLAQMLLASRRGAARAGLASIAAAFAAAIGWGVGGGRHLAAPGDRAGFAAFVGIAAGGLVFALAPQLARWLRKAPRTALVVLALFALTLELANQVVLTRLYPAFHWALAASTLLLAPLLAAAFARVAFPPGGSTRLAWALAAAAVVLPAALVLPTAERLARFDNFRFVLLERAPLLGRGVELAATVVPPEPAEAGDCQGAPGGCGGPAGTGAGRGKTWDLSSRDLLVISVDALRADHVGAYGYPRPTTPNIDALARTGAVFERAYTATPHTSYAITSLMTGKYMRPLLLQGAGADSDTWATLLRTYGYRTAAFYPPAVFFIDTARFSAFQQTNLGFEYVKVEFAAAEREQRLSQIDEYLARSSDGKPLFMWVHLFAPHEPYVAQAGHAFGERDIDRYDSEVAFADATVGAIVARLRKSRPSTAVIVTADHGEEFGEHGGRYHGTTVYEEQLRVPLVINAPGALAPGRFREVVQTIDILPTVLAALDIPRPPRLRGRDLGPLLSGQRAEEPGLAHGETDEQALLAEGDLRLVCARRIGACKLYDLSRDPRQREDVSQARPADFQRLRQALRALGASHGRYETQGLRAEGKGWPDAIVRGLSGEADSVTEIAALLDDVDPAIRRKSAEVLIDLKRPEAAPALRLAVGRDEDELVRKLAALALTRLGEGAPRVVELLGDPEPRYRRLAALGLAEGGDARGLPVLLEWWKAEAELDFMRSREIVEAFAVLRAKDAVPALTARLGDVRLRPELARALARIGEESARYPLARALADERLQSTRAALTSALVELGARYELVPPLVRFLGVPDPLPDGLKAALDARILVHVGGPEERELPRLRERSEIGTRVRLVIPKAGNGKGVRALVRTRCPAAAGRGELLLGSADHLVRYDRRGKLVPQRKVPELDTARALRFQVPCSGSPTELFAPVPATISARPGTSVELILFASRDIHVEALALVPLADELPPPAPKPWAPGAPSSQLDNQPRAP